MIFYDGGNRNTFAVAFLVGSSNTDKTTLNTFLEGFMLRRHHLLYHSAATIPLLLEPLFLLLQTGILLENKNQDRFSYLKAHLCTAYCTVYYKVFKHNRRVHVHSNLGLWETIKQQSIPMLLTGQHLSQTHSCTRCQGSTGFGNEDLNCQLPAFYCTFNCGNKELCLASILCM